MMGEITQVFVPGKFKGIIAFHLFASLLKMGNKICRQPKPVITITESSPSIREADYNPECVPSGKS